MLIYRGLFPTGLDADDTIPGLRHPLQYPLKYGYAVVGEIIAADNGITIHTVAVGDPRSRGEGGASRRGASATG